MHVRTYCSVGRSRRGFRFTELTALIQAELEQRNDEDYKLRRGVEKDEVAKKKWWRSWKLA